MFGCCCFFSSVVLRLWTTVKRLAAERKYLLTWTAEMNGLAVIEAARPTNLHPFHERCSLERIVWMIMDNRNLQIQAAGNFF